MFVKIRQNAHNMMSKLPLTLALSLVMWLGMAFTANGQAAFPLEPAKGFNSSNGQWELRLLHKHDRNIRLDYGRNLDGAGASFKIGRNPNSYSFRSVSVSGTTTQFNPSTINLPPGRYYGRITNSEATTTSGIMGDTREGLVYSNEILLIVEAPDAATVIAPRGQITDPTPTFEWEAVPGVVAYWIIFSSTPFEIVTDENDDISVEGANLVWQYMTTETSAVYGQINANIDGASEAPPLNSGQEYSYTVLNLYEEENPAFASAVFGGVIPMTYFDPDAIDPPTLVSPAADVVFSGEEEITFQWTEVPDAAYYRITLFEVITQQGVDATIPVWTTTTSNTLIDYPALANLKNSNYLWNVVAHNDFGGGSGSPNRGFVYEIPSGEFQARAREASDQSQITGVEIRARAVSGGVTPSTPFLLQGASITGDLVAGTYEITASKEGYENAVITTEILDGQRRQLMFDMQGLPAFISGRVVDQDGQVLDNALVRLTDFVTGDRYERSTNTNGEFAWYVPAGSFSFRASRAGYVPSAEQSVTLELGDQFAFDDDIVLVNDQAELSGFVLSSAGNPIQLATVRVEKGGEVMERTTNSQGFFAFTLSSGEWAVTARRNGFVPSQPRVVTLATGDNVQNSNITLSGGANQISGFVREVIVNPDGTTGVSAMRDVTVTATPSTGSSVSTVSSNTGQFSLNLGSGSYTITASRSGYTLENPVNLVLEFGQTVSNLDLRLEANESFITGFTRLPDGNALGGVTVSVPGVASTTSTPNGQFTLSVAPGDYAVQSARSGHTASDPVSVSVAAGQTLEGISFVLSPNAGTIRGSVSSGGQPVVNATVRAVSSTGQARTATTNNMGAYELNVSSGTHTLSATRQGFVTSDELSVTLSPGQQVSGRNFTLQPNVRPVSGIVTSGGAVLRSATVTVTSPDDPGFSESTVTQVSGAYAFSLPAGRAYTVRASRTGYSAASQTTQTLTPGSEAVTVNLSLQENPASIAGVVTNQAGQPVRQARVEALNGNGEVQFSAQTSSTGAYTLGLASGTFTVRTSLAGHTTQTSDLTIEAGQALTGVNVTLPENFAVISGQVRSTDNTAVEGALVSISRNEGGNNASRTTGVTGNYSYSRMTTGTYTVQVSRSGFGSFSVNDLAVTDGQQVSLDVTLVPQTGLLAGEVFDALGNPVAGASVSATGQNTGASRSAVTGDDGSFSMGNVAFDTFNLVASASGFSASSAVMVPISEQEPTANDIVIDDLVENNGVIAGRIVDSVTGAGIRQVSVNVTGPAGSGNAVTNTAGEFEISNLSPGEYQVQATRDGYSSFSSSVTLTIADPVDDSVQGELLLNNGQIAGRVTNQAGQSLGQSFGVRALAGDLLYTTTTNSNGNFRFENMQTGLEYTIETQAVGQGLVNTVSQVELPPGVELLELSDNVVVTVNNAVIRGNAGTGGVELRLVDQATGSVVNVRNSEPDGTFRFRFLPAGSYELTASRSGFVISPDQVEISNLSFGGEQVVNLSAVPNIGSIVASAVDSDGNPVGSTSFTAVSADESVIVSRTAGSGGSVTFADLPAGRTYTVRATRDGFAADPASRSVELQTGASATASFVMQRNLSSIAGTVRRSDTNAGVGEARVTVRNLATNVVREVTTPNNGSYQVSNIPEGEYRVVARRSGFVPDTLHSVQVGFNQSVTGQNLSLVPAQLTALQGFVIYQGDGVPDLDVVIESQGVTYTLKTDGNGRYRVPQFPVRPGDGETTLASITVTSGAFTAEQLITITSAQIGTTVTADGFVIPSGQIAVSVTDGVNPLQGMQVQMIREGGTTLRSYTTGASGVVESAAQLLAGTYRITVSGPGVVLPSGSFQVVLADDTDTANLDVALPYLFSPPEEILAGDATTFEVRVTEGYDASGATAVLRYRLASQSTFRTLDFVANGTTLQAELPALLSLEELVFSVQITDPGSPVTYVSPQVTMQPRAVDLISAIRVQPDLSGQRLRTNDTYRLRLSVTDGENQSMAARFFGPDADGEVRVSSELSNLTVSVEGDELLLQVGGSAGAFSFQLRSELEEQVFVRNITVQVTDEPVQTLALSRPAQRLSNSTSANFSYTARDAAGNRILLGNQLIWSIDRPGIGSISTAGRFTPVAGVISEFRVSARDQLTGVEAVSDVVGLFAQIREDNDYTLSDGRDMQLFIPAQAITETAEISMRITRPETPKKYVVAQGTNMSLTASEEVYRIRYSGSALGAGATLELPEPESLALFEGARHIGRFNQQSLQWELFDTQSAGGVYRIRDFSRLGQFTVLTQNEPLGIDRFMVLPNPFSPDIAPGARIGYMLTTDAPPAIVTIEIFNLRGQLVRQLLKDEPQLPGRYGSRTSQREIYWDGLTDNGTMANNGRYVVRIHVQDGKNTIQKLEQIVLIK